MTAASRQLVSSLRVTGLAFAVTGAGVISLLAQTTPAQPKPTDASATATAAAGETKPAAPVGTIAGVAADLGHGLRYVRVAELPAQLDATTAALKDLPVVLDLRRVTATASAIETLRGALRAAAADGRGAVFLLIGADTPSSVLAAVPESSRVITLAAEADGLKARVTIKTSATDDRAAYEAIVAGRSLSELITEKVDKRRFDEAHLAKAHADNGGRDNLDDDVGLPPDSGAPADDATAAAPAAKAKPEAAAKDLVLQRAVFLHRALLALNKLPAHS